MKNIQARSSLAIPLVLACLLGSSLAARATNLVVTNLDDSGPGSLRQAIIDASSGDTITFATNGTIAIASTLVISSNLNIFGPGPGLLSVSAGNATRVFLNQAGVTSSIAGLTIRDGKTGVGVNGAGIYNSGVLTLSNCVVTANLTGSGANGSSGSNGTRGGDGAGIYSIGDLTLIACTISYNTDGSGGKGGDGVNGNLTTPNGSNGGDGGRGGNGAGILSSGTLSMTNCSVIGNVAGAGAKGGNGGDGRVGVNTDGGDGGNGGDAGRGAGLYVSGPTTLVRCLFDGSQTLARGAGGAGGAAGGLGTSGTPGSPGAGGHGAAVSMTGDSLAIQNCSFTANTATSPGAGGGLYCSGGSLVVINSTLVSNSAGTGGGIYKTGSAILMTNSIVALNSGGSYSNVYITIWGTNNFVDGDPMLATLANYGGPTMTLPPLFGSPVLDAGDDSVTNDFTTDQRGYARLSGAHVDIGAVEVQAASALNPPAATTLPATNVGPHTATLRGLVSSHGADTTAWFEWGADTSYGNVTSPQFVEGDAGVTDFAQTITGIIAGGTQHFRLVVASQLGLTYGQDAAFTAPDLVVTNLANSGPGSLRQTIADATSGDTIIFGTNGTITLTSGELLIEKDLTIVGPGAASLAISGANSYRVLEIANAEVTLDSVSISRGYAGGSGGGILVDGAAVLTLNNCAVSGNSAGSYGGGIDNEGTLTLNHSTIAFNNAEFDGGGIYSAGTGTLNNCTVSGNFCSADQDDCYGGGIASDGSLALADCTISDNYCSGYDYPCYGGGIYNGGTNTLNNCIVSGNYCSTFNDDSYGGGIDNENSLTLYGCTISENSCSSWNYDSYGGGIYNDATGTLNDSTLSANFAYDAGGGIENWGALTLNNCTLSGNSANYGGGINHGNGTNTLNHCTLVANTAVSGGGILVSGSACFLTNSIVAGNLASTLPDINGSFFGANNLTNGNPLLAPLGDYGGPTQTMPPLAGSPAIDAGDDSTTNLLATDQRGYPRKSGAHVDIGAVEAQYAPANNPPRLTGSTLSTVGGSNSFQFTFTNVPNADFTVLATTNLTLPLADWIPVGNAAQSPAGQYQFTDPAVTNYPQRFYQVVSP